MRIAHYDSSHDNAPVCLDMSWSDLVEMLTAPAEPACSVPGAKSLYPPCAGRECQVKHGRAWSPVDIEGPRANANVRAVTVAVFDLDHLTYGQVVLVDKAVEEAGLAAVLHSTHSHDPDGGDWCLRLVLKLSRPVTPDEWPRVRAALVRQLGLPADEATKDLSRIYFLPSHRDGVEPVSAATEGADVDVDSLLRAAPTPSAAPAAPIDALALRAALEKARRAKARGDERERGQAEVLGRVLEGDPLASSGARDSTLLRAVGLVVYHAPPGTAWEHVREVLGPSITAMDCEPEGFEHWVDLARQKYERAARAKAANDARKAAEEAALRELVGRVATARTPQAVAAEAGDAWETLLIAGDEGPRACEYNVDLILSCDPETKGALRYDEVSKRLRFTSGPAAGAAEGDLGGVVAGWMQRKYGIMAGAKLVGEALLRVGRACAYDPLREYLRELAWDGDARVDGFLGTYFGAPDGAYERAVSRRLLVALVARALQPGCEMQNVVILEGAQGLGKTRGLRALAGPYYLGTSVHVGDKDFLQLIAGAWLVELGELASLRRAENEKTKQFLDQKSDKFRPPYGRVTEESPRRCVFIGTTNESDYLTDRTGNRRYIPVKVGQVDVDAIGRDRDQLFAEAVALYDAGERWWLEGEEVTMAAEAADERLDRSLVEEAVERWWRGETPARRPASFTALDVAERALHLTADKVDLGLRRDITGALRGMGFLYRQRVHDGQRGWRFVATDELMKLPVEKRDNLNYLGIVAGAKTS